MATYKIVSHGGSGLPLNVYGTGTITARRNVCIWTDTGSADQRWAIDSLESDQTVRSMNNQSYMLNANRSNWTCDVYTLNPDSYVNFISLGNNVYRIQLVSDSTKYLKATDTSSESDVIWAVLDTASNAQQWKFTEVSTGGSGSSEATSASALQAAFQNEGDYDGAYGLQCVDIVKWYIDTYTTLASTSGNGEDLVANLANKYDLEIENTPKAPGIFSVAGGYQTWGCSGSEFGHTGVVVSVDTTNKTATVIHTGNSLTGKTPNSWVSTYSYPATGVTFVYLGNHLK